MFLILIFIIILFYFSHWPLSVYLVSLILSFCLFPIPSSSPRFIFCQLLIHRYIQHSNTFILIIFSKQSHFSLFFIWLVGSFYPWFFFQLHFNRKEKKREKKKFTKKNKTKQTQKKKIEIKHTTHLSLQSINTINHHNYNTIIIIIINIINKVYTSIVHIRFLFFF